MSVAAVAAVVVSGAAVLGVEAVAAAVEHSVESANARVAPRLSLARGSPFASRSIYYKSRT